MMKKYFPLVLGASLITGVAGLVLRKKKTACSDNFQQFIGTWQYQKTPVSKPITVTITDDYQLYLQDQPETTILVELTPNRLVLLDGLGYHITIEEKDGQLHFYDETEDRSFVLIPKIQKESP